MLSSASSKAEGNRVPALSSQHRGQSWSSVPYDPNLRRRLAEYADTYPDHCRRLDKGKYPDYVEYEIDKDRLSVRLLPPVSEEQRRIASEKAKALGLGTRISENHLKQ